MSHWDMLPRRLLLTFLTLVLLTGMRGRAVGHPPGTEPVTPPHDQFTSSNTSEVTTRHLSLDLAVDFATRTLSGTATLFLNNPAGANRLFLDTEQLDVRRVTLDSGAEASWRGDPLGGGALDIDIEPDTKSVTVEYTTNPGAPGLNWNTAAQSAGHKQPYLYSLNEPTGARSWIPIQDTPSMRFTYDARLHVPRGLLALMSADGNATTPNDLGVYTFSMPYPVPAYLVALAVGRLEFHPFDERTGVYAEPELMEDAAWELQYLPAMVDTAEELAGPFPFTRHDVLLMPPTFTAGGMEHPMLNFINPFSVVSGNHPVHPDPKSLIAHELAHTWSGDATTLATWDDVWLNEGITSYLALRIVESMTGVETAELQWFLDRRSYASFAQNASDPDATILHRDVPHPFAGFGATGYLKGELFVRTIEDAMGRADFDAFLRHYFQRFAFRWVDDRAFLSVLRERLTADEESSLRLDEWVYGRGLPSNVSAPASSVLYDRVLQRAVSFNAGTPIVQLGAAEWSSAESDLFLQLASPGAVRARMSEVDAALGLSTRVTAPNVWLNHAIFANYLAAMPALERALAKGGPNGSVLQLYYALVQVPGGRARAIEYFSRYRDRYSVAVEQQLVELLALSGVTSEAA